MLGLVFVAGIAAGTVIPGRDRLPWSGPSAAPLIPPATNPASPAGPASWSRDGHAGVRHSVDVVRVIDGDTFEARVHLWPGLEMMTRVRLRGIDAPEMKGACAEESRMAEASHEALRALLAGGDVAIFNIGPDKYNGRVVADAATSRTPSVASALLVSGHVRPYQGGRRSGWCTAAMR
ncbi:endonuclease YncB(thermonuclease family) [Afipia massiliensis]|uniref:Endonuclease YncB(Thermonuclease family) n=1 Tax=Afipia massiliensis TaxID=211460 RepID=A0A840N0N9_9BRAD|nr:thermonuclease family protein [Afipia massiliensis]MBB5052037.1 endonuclease YncB(thermonuclease family) [Afipia massiliensis]